jgi:hypothetical protein
MACHLGRCRGEQHFSMVVVFVDLWCVICVAMPLSLPLSWRWCGVLVLSDFVFVLSSFCLILSDFVLIKARPGFVLALSDFV